MIDAETSLETLKNMQIMINNFCRIEDGTLMKSIDMRQYGRDTGEMVNNITIQELCMVHPGFCRLDLSYCKLVTDVGLWAIAKHCLELDMLVLTGCEKITNVGIRSLSLRNARLTTLDLSNCYLIDDICLTIIAGGGWKIQYLYLRYCHKVTDNGIVRIADGQGKHLQVLDLTGCINVGEFGDRALREIGTNCKVLKELYMTESKRVEDSGIIAVSTGCQQLQFLGLAGCENITKKGFFSLCKTHNPMQILKISGCRKITDTEFEMLNHSSLQQTLTSVDFTYIEKLTDRGVGAICKALGSKLYQLNLSNCNLLTDYSTMIIGNLCKGLRSLDLQHCGHITDDSIHSLARNITCLTCLKLDGNNKITTRTLIMHIGVEFEFVDMAVQWLGYQPKQRVEDLIKAKEVFVLQTKQALLIQSALRRKFAKRIYWERYRSHLINHVIPLFQSRVRGMQQRKRYAIMLWHVLRHKKSVIIQAKWRKYYALHQRIKEAKRKRWALYRIQLAVMIQKYYRGWVARKRVDALRVDLGNALLVRTKRKALEETRAIIIQRIYHGFKARQLVNRLAEMRRERIALAAWKDQSARLIQRIIHGKIGRIRAQYRRWEIAHAEFMWRCARDIQRVFRGSLGRERFRVFKAAYELQKQMDAATTIQRHYRGHCGRLLAAVARALRILRSKHQYYALELQRFLRGCVGRHHFNVHKEFVLRRRTQIKSSIAIQRIFRGHKGREARVIEFELRTMDTKAKPLLLHLKHTQEAARVLARQVHILEDNEKRMSENLFAIERELAQCMYSTSKYSDSSRINNTPQRFLTKFLAVRLKDLLEHETEIHKIKFTELQKRRAEYRDLDHDIQFTLRELVPLTTGLISDIKRRRTMGLRKMIWKKRDSATKIQSIWRRALVRSALYDPWKLFWVNRLDLQLSDQEYYYNLKTFEVCWTKPIAYRYYGNLFEELPPWALDL